MSAAEIIQNLPLEDYLSRPALSVSKLKAFAKAPALVNFAKEETAAMRMGSLVHCAVLEPGELDFRYAAVDLERAGTNLWDACSGAAKHGIAFLEKLCPLTGSPSSKPWKDAKEAGLIPILNGDYEMVKWIAREQPDGGRELVKQSDMDAALRMRDAVWSNPVARELLEGCQTEVSAFWSDEETGLECKARADIWNPRIRVLGDIKTTCSAHPRDFMRDFAKLKYGWQDAHYREAFRDCEAFVFIAIEKETNLVKAYYLSPSQIEQVRAQVRHYKRKYAECLELDHFPGYGDSLHEIMLPAWALNEHEEA